MILETWRGCSLLAGVSLLIMTAATMGQPAATAQTPPPKRIPGLSPAAERAAQALSLSPGFEASLFASEPLLANPVAFCVDEQTNVFVCETFRLKRGVEDNRDHKDWIDDDLAAKTVNDRLDFFKKHLQGELERYTEHQDRIRIIQDRNQDGRADRASVFADGFHDVLEGPGAGILSWRGTVYYACVPRLWAFRDDDADGKADKRKAMFDGFGVHVAFYGHDLHGLKLGPDGRLYFSMGDRGLNVETEGRKLEYAESGSVLRCELDGSNLEMIATGFRNPQDLVFDDYGNLFTADNNSDSGDLARWLHVLPGADYGWRMAYQYLPDRGPWNRERIWDADNRKPPAFAMPPVANTGDGPSGLAYYPGTGMSIDYRGNFFMCDFRGVAGMSGVRTFKMKPRGASFELIDPELFVWNCLPTDIDIAPDGSVFILDWVDGWSGTGKGRIFRVWHAKGIEAKASREVAEILRVDLREAKPEQLSRLLAHPDRRLRHEAQFQLARMFDIKTLAQVAHTSKIQLARLHAVWGLGQIGRSSSRAEQALDEVLPLVRDIDQEVRVAAATVLGDARYALATGRLIGVLRDVDPRVRCAAALALARLEAPEAVDPLVDVLIANADQDVAIRHAAAFALKTCARPQALRDLAKHSNRSARLGALLALRMRHSPSLATFLEDEDPAIAEEAARGIYDLTIDKAMPQLAELIGQTTSTNEMWLRRILAANFRLGGGKQAAALVKFAADSSRPMATRTDALTLLGHWSKPPSRDFITGMWRPLDGERDAAEVQEPLTASLQPLLDGDQEVRLATARLAARLKIEESKEFLIKTLNDLARDGEERASALVGLANFQFDQLPEIVKQRLDDRDPHVRAAARTLQARLDPQHASEPLWQALRKGTDYERQMAIRVLANLATPDADDKIASVMRLMLNDQVPETVRLDILQAVRRRAPAVEELQQLLVRYENSWDPQDPVAAYRDVLQGGDARRGERLFYDNSVLQCTKCHRIADRGSELGPELTRIGTQRERQQLVESIAYPNRTITEGYETVILGTKDGSVVSGIVKHRTEQRITVADAEGNLKTVRLDDIESTSAGKSPMPENLVDQMSMFQLRDLIEFLATQE